MLGIWKYVPPLEYLYVLQRRPRFLPLATIWRRHVRWQNRRWVWRKHVWYEVTRAFCLTWKYRPIEPNQQHPPVMIHYQIKDLGFVLQHLPAPSEIAEIRKFRWNLGRNERTENIKVKTKNNRNYTLFYLNAQYFTSFWLVKYLSGDWSGRILPKFCFSWPKSKTLVSMGSSRWLGYAGPTRYHTPGSEDNEGAKRRYYGNCITCVTSHSDKDPSGS